MTELLERHVLSIADPSGDTRIMWDPKKKDEVATARAAFDEAKKKGMLAYMVDPESADKGEVIRTFDPKAGKIIMSRALQGGLMTQQQAKCGVDVVAGIIPGQPMDEFFRQWFITSEEWQAATRDESGSGQANLLTDLAGKATAYATYLMLQPDRLNWVKTEWIWF